MWPLPHLASRARTLQQRLHQRYDPLSAALDGQRLFEEAGDATRARWLTLELQGYAEHVPARPLHIVLGVPSGDRLAAHVRAYRSQRGIDATPGQAPVEFRHFFVEPLAYLVESHSQVARSVKTATLLLEFGPEPGVPSYPRRVEFTHDVFDRIVLGFVAALHLQLGTLA